MQKRPPVDLGKKKSTRKILVSASVILTGGICACGHPFTGSTTHPGFTGVAPQSELTCTSAQAADATVVKCCEMPAEAALNQPECTLPQKQQLSVGSQRCCPVESDAAPKVGIAPSGPPSDSACTTVELTDATTIQCCVVPDTTALNQSQCTAVQQTDLQAGFDRCCPPKVAS